MEAMTEAISLESQFICPACCLGNDVCHRVSGGVSGDLGDLGDLGTATDVKE